MAIANPASPQAGPQPEPQREPKSEPGMMTTDTGDELIRALPGAAPQTSSSGAGSRVAYSNEISTVAEISGRERELDGPAGNFVSPPGSEDPSALPAVPPSDTSASYPSGFSSADLLRC